MPPSELARIHEDILQKVQKDQRIDLATIPEKNNFNLESRIRLTLDQCYPQLNIETRGRVLSEFFNLGPIHSLVSDHSITEIIITGHQSIWYEKSGKLHQHQDSFFSSSSYCAFLQRMSHDIGLITNLNIPYADGQWLDFRVHLITPPLSNKEPQLTLRRHPQNPWTYQQLESNNWSSPKNIETIKSWLKNKKSLLIIGGTGTGKTSVLNACLQEMPKSERVVIIEDSDEVQAPNLVSSKLKTRIDNQSVLQSIDTMELVKQALRMRPDRIVVGEIRGSEAKDFLLALSTGHGGSLCSLHADHPRQALIRLEMLTQMGAPQWSLNSIRQLIALSIHGIIHVERSAEGRRLSGLYEIVCLEDTGFCLQPVHQPHL